MNAPFRVIEVAFKNRQALKKSYLCDPENGGLVVSTTSPVRVDELVDLKIWLRREDLYLVIRGVVLWSRSKTSRAREVGIGFLKQESDKRDLLLRHTRVLGREARARQNARLAATMKVIYKNSWDYVIDTTKDLSSGGMFIHSVRQPLLNSIILFELCVPGELKTIEVLGRVTWRCPGQGIGVRFMGNDPEARRRLDRLVSTIPMVPEAAAG